MYFNSTEPEPLQYILESRFEFPSLGLSIKGRKSFMHTIEIFNLYYDNSIETVNYQVFRTRKFSLQWSYSFMWFFLKRNSKLEPFVEAGVSAFYEDVLPKLIETSRKNFFPIGNRILNSYIDLGAGLHYQPLKWLYLQFNLPISWMIFGHQFIYVYNPTLTERQRSGPSGNMRQVPVYTPERTGFQLVAGFIF